MLSQLWKRWKPKEKPPEPDNVIRLGNRMIEVHKVGLEARLLLLFDCKEFLVAAANQDEIEPYIGQLVKLVSVCSTMTEDWLKNNLTLGELMQLFLLVDHYNGFIEATPYLIVIGWAKHG